VSAPLSSRILVGFVGHRSSPSNFLFSPRVVDDTVNTRTWVAAGAGISCMAGTGMVSKGTKSAIQMPEELRALEAAEVIIPFITGVGAASRGTNSGHTAAAVHDRELARKVLGRPEKLRN
jgi:hypothetical protein